jgi:hypothetical protein
LWISRLHDLEAVAQAHLLFQAFEVGRHLFAAYRAAQTPLVQHRSHYFGAGAKTLRRRCLGVEDANIAKHSATFTITTSRRLDDAVEAR